MDSEKSNVEVTTRANLAYFWSIIAALFIFYVLVEFGKEKEILTLLIGFVTGVISTVLAVYFGAPITSKKPDTSVIATGDNPSVNTNPTTVSEDK